MIRIFLAPEHITSDTISITGDNARHLSRVLRIKPGETIIVYDGQGYRFACSVQEVHKKEIIALLTAKEACSVESPLSITLAQGIARGEKMDLVVQKSTELGVSSIVPVITERTEVRHTQKVERWRKIALSAAQQAGRNKIPEISEPMELTRLLSGVLSIELQNSRDVIPAKAGIQKKEWIPDQARNDKKSQDGNIDNRHVRIILSESYAERNLKQVITGFKDVKHLILLVGPEGGFSKDEVKAATENDFMEVSLGPRILRTETAPLAAISILQYELGDMG